MITRDELEALLNTKASPAVTLYTPTNLPSLAVRQDAIRLGNQLDEAARKLREMGWRDRECGALLEPARRLLGDDRFWENSTPGLAIFLAPAVEPRIWRLRAPVEQLTVVGTRFLIAPLLPQSEGESTFFVLTITAKAARLYKGDRESLREIRDTGLPQSVQDTVAARTDYEQTSQSNPMSGHRSGRAGASGMPGSMPADQSLGPSPEEQRKSELLQYLNKLAAAYEKGFGNLSGPVVLAAQPEIAGNFRAQTSAGNLWPEILDVNPGALDVAELHRRAWDLVKAKADGDVAAVIDHFNSLYQDGSPRASTEPAEIVRAARWGKMDTLILAEGEHVWGHFDEQADQVETHKEPAPLDDDLLDLAAQQTLLNGGEVRVVARDHVPGGAAAAAIMRY